MTTPVEETRRPFTIDELARWVTIWYADVANNMLAAVNVPDDVPVTVRIPEGSEPRVLEGAERAAFLGGIEYAIGLLGTLPFEPVEIEVDEQPQQD